MANGRVFDVIFALRAVATEYQTLAASFSDEQAVRVLAITDELRARFQPPASSATAAEEEVPTPELRSDVPSELLSDVPPELMLAILSQLDTRDLASLAATCRSLWCDAPTFPSLLPPGLVVSELRRRAEARGLHIGSSLPEGALSWLPYLLRRAFVAALRSQIPLACGQEHSLFVDGNGTLLTHGRESDGKLLLGHAVDPEADLAVFREIGPPTPVPSMQGMRMVSVATSDAHCLALSAAGEVYSWGTGELGVLGHVGGGARAVPCRVEMLSRIERIAAARHTSAVIDEKGSLYTWGSAIVRDAENGLPFGGPAGLGYELDPGTEYQATPKRVDALSEDRVVDAALGHGFTLAVTDAGAAFSFGKGLANVLGHGFLGSEVLPRRIQALAETGRRCVAVAAGEFYSLAMTEEGDLYGWGAKFGNGHGRDQSKPQRLDALTGERVELVCAHQCSSCAMTEKGEIFTWGLGQFGQLGHGDETIHSSFSVQSTPKPKRVEALSSVKVAVVAIGYQNMLAADEEGVVWRFGKRSTLGLGAADAPPGDGVMQPTPIPNLRVRTLKFK